jgi:hypothetical protein
MHLCAPIGLKHPDAPSFQGDLFKLKIQSRADKVMNLPPDGVLVIPVRNAGDRAIVLYTEDDRSAVGIGHRQQGFRHVARHLFDRAGTRVRP